MEAKKQAKYDADLYLRLSHEDGDKAESDSIANQRELLMDYLSSHPEIRLHEVRTDDGYSGVNYDRPGFIQMMEAVKAGEINCIIVKDDCVILELNSESPENTGLCDVSSVF